MSAPTLHVDITAEQLEDGRWIARVSPISYGPFPIGTRPLPFGANTRAEAVAGLKKYVRGVLHGRRVMFSGSHAGGPL